MKRKLAFVSLCFLAVCSASAQNGIEMLRKIEQKYVQGKAMELELLFRYYEDISSAKPYTTQKSSIKTEAKKLSIVSGSNHTIQNDKYLILIDHERKVVMLDRAPAKLQQPMNLDSLLGMYESCQFTKAPDGSGLLNLLMKKGATSVEKAVIRFNTTTYEIQQVQVYYREMENPQNGKKIRPWIKIDYVSTKLNSPIDQSHFDEKKVFELKNKSVILSKPYIKYELISHL